MALMENRQTDHAYHFWFENFRTICSDHFKETIFLIAAKIFLSTEAKISSSILGRHMGNNKTFVRISW